MPSMTKPSGKSFQLPALDLKFGSLTEGTNIPPPPPSPIREEPEPIEPVRPNGTHVAVVATTVANNNGTQTTPTVHRSGPKSPVVQQTPGSPLSTKGSPSIRRLFSGSRAQQKDTAHANGDPPTGDYMFPRPVSQSNASIATDGHSKRASTGWFRRLRGSDGLDSRRSSKMFVPALASAPASKALPVAPKVPAGPPPPMIPDFKSLGSKVDLGGDGGSLGSDMFKDIK